MKSWQQVGQRIREMVSASPGCSLDDIVDACREFSWNQIVSEIDQLTRGGVLILKREGSMYRFFAPEDVSSARSMTVPHSSANSLSVPSEG